MPTYKYKCENGHDYSELRTIEQEQIYTECSSCGTKYTEVTE